MCVVSNLNMQKITDDFGRLLFSIQSNKGYLYAIKKIKGKKVQIYIGKEWPNESKLIEIYQKFQTYTTTL